MLFSITCTAQFQAAMLGILAKRTAKPDKDNTGTTAIAKKIKTLS